MAAGKARQYLDLGGAKNIKQTKKTKRHKRTNKQKKKQFWGSLEERGGSSQESLRIVLFVFVCSFVFVFLFSQGLLALPRLLLVSSIFSRDCLCLFSSAKDIEAAFTDT